MGKRSKKNKKNIKNENKYDEMVVTEERFSAAETRPQFRPLKKEKSKVVLDERFSSVLTDPRFQLLEKDKYGRRRKKKHAAKEELSAFYTVEEKDVKKRKESENTDDYDELSSTSSVDSNNESSENQAKDDDDEQEEPGKSEDPESRISYLTALSRGELDVSSSSAEDDSSDSSDEGDEEDGEDPVYGTAGILDPSKREEDIEISYVPSPFLVATNLDWENVRAIDVFTILSSFTPPGAVKRVQVYQSDFGIEKMAKDRLYGPSDIWKKKKVDTARPSDRQDSEVESEGEEEESDDDSELRLNIEVENVSPESDFDPEKLRAYEASKLKYFFAVVEFSSPENADIAYREVDGMEFEHSSSCIDLRTLPPEEVDNVVNGRPMRDEAISVPSNYEPPDFIVGALQQTIVRCTWDQGDTEREKKLTKYGSGGWWDIGEQDDLKAYLASDVSSEDESSDERGNKGSQMRKLLGLDSGGEEEAHGSGGEGSSDEESKEEKEMEIKYLPGKKNLEEKIRTKLQSKGEADKLTPWQKYQEKRKEKRRERRQAARKKESGDDDEKESNPSDSDGPPERRSPDEFFIDEKEAEVIAQPERGSSERGHKSNHRLRSGNEELELLLAGEDEEEEARDFDIRGIQRLEKNKGKKLRGSRKRKEDKLAADVSGKDFKVDVHDDRFAAVLDGADDRFGIDKTDPHFKDTSAMRAILSEQQKRRKKKRQRTQEVNAVPDVSAESDGKSAGASALSSLVKRLKSKVSNNSQ